MTEYKLPSHSIHNKPPIQGAIASQYGWHHPQTNELLVSVRGLQLNDSADPERKDSSQATVSNTRKTPEGSGNDPQLFSLEVIETGIKVTILAPNQHASTRWTVNGNPIADKGNEIVVQLGDSFVAKSAKGEFKGQA